MKTGFSIFLVIVVFVFIDQSVLAQTLYVPPSTTQPRLVPRQNLNQNSSPANVDKDGKKFEPKLAEIPAMFRDRASALVDIIPRGDVVACTLTMKARTLTGGLVDTSTPWKCRVSDLGAGVKQIETVVFEKLAEIVNASPEKMRPTFVYVAVGAKPNSQTAMSRPLAQATPQRFFMPFAVEGSFGVAAN